MSRKIARKILARSLTLINLVPVHHRRCAGDPAAGLAARQPLHRGAAGGRHQPQGRLGEALCRPRGEPEAPGHPGQPADLRAERHQQDQHAEKAGP